MGAAWGEESLGTAWKNEGKHLDSEDESVGVGMGWDGLTQSLEMKACAGLEKLRRQRKKKWRVWTKLGWQGLQHGRPERDREEGTCGGSSLQCTHPGCDREVWLWAHRVRAGPTTWL